MTAFYIPPLSKPETLVSPTVAIYSFFIGTTAPENPPPFSGWLGTGKWEILLNIIFSRGVESVKQNDTGPAIP
ncbi:MAG: hypothetical protein ACLFM6_09375, partial [Spirochaetaceae bacterium]